MSEENQEAAAVYTKDAKTYLNGFGLLVVAFATVLGSTAYFVNEVDYSDNNKLLDGFLYASCAYGLMTSLFMLCMDSETKESEAERELREKLVAVTEEKDLLALDISNVKQWCNELLDQADREQSKVDVEDEELFDRIDEIETELERLRKDSSRLYHLINYIHSRANKASKVVTVQLTDDELAKAYNLPEDYYPSDDLDLAKAKWVLDVICYSNSVYKNAVVDINNEYNKTIVEAANVIAETYETELKHVNNEVDKIKGQLAAAGEERIVAQQRAAAYLKALTDTSNRYSQLIKANS